MMNAKTKELSERLLKLTLKRKEIEGEEKEIRFALESLLKEKEYIHLPCGGKIYRVMNEPTETRVLHDNQMIAKNIGKEAFLKIASVTLASLTSVVGKEEIDKYIHRVTTSYRVVVREDKEAKEAKTAKPAKPVKSGK